MTVACDGCVTCQTGVKISLIIFVFGRIFNIFLSACNDFNNRRVNNNKISVLYMSD